MSQLPGWHTTIFPPYFVAGAIYSGFGMVLTLLVPLRKICKLEDIITMRHMEMMCKVTLATGSIVGYAYAMEYFIAWYSGNPYERLDLLATACSGPTGTAVLDDAVVQRAVAAVVLVQEDPDQNLVVVFIISIFVNIGMWFERFVIIVDVAVPGFPAGQLGVFPADVGGHVARIWARFGLFFTLFLLFMRFLPMIAISEVKGVTPQADPHHPLGGAETEGVTDEQSPLKPTE